MTLIRPEFHLQRVNSDGSVESPEVYSLRDVPFDFQTTRRGILGTGLTAAGVLGLLSGCGTSNKSAAPETPAPDAELTEQKRVGNPATKVFAHKSRVNCLAVTSDGKMLASGSHDNTVKLWSLPEGKLLQTLTHDGTVECMAVTPDGNMLASGSDDDTIKLWSLPEGKLLQTLIGHKDTVECLAVTSDGNVLASGSCGLDAIKLWSLPEGKLLQTLTHHSFLNCLAVTPDGNIFASGSIGELKLWSLPEERLLQTLTHDHAVTCLAVTPDGNILASGSADKTVKLWLMPEGKLLRTLTHDNPVDCLAVTPDGNMLASGSWYNTIKLWSLPEGKLLQTLIGHERFVVSLMVTPDGNMLASGDDDGVVILWDLPLGTQRGYLFDPQASQTDAFVYNTVDTVTGQTLTYTLPCGSPTPAGATCVCNCVPGTYEPPIRSGGGSSSCTCNKICTCIPVCQAHQLLHPDPVVRKMAEELLFVMGDREFEYMRWAAHQAEADLKQRVEQSIAAIQQGARPNPSRWPTIAECSARLNGPDEIVCVMAAQMIDLQRDKADWSLDAADTQRVAALLEDARRRPWYVRAHENRHVKA